MSASGINFPNGVFQPQGSNGIFSRGLTRKEGDGGDDGGDASGAGPGGAAGQGSGGNGGTEGNASGEGGGNPSSPPTTTPPVDPNAAVVNGPKTYPQNTPPPIPDAFTSPANPTPNVATDALGNVASTAYGRATSKFFPLEDQLVQSVQKYQSPAYAAEQEGKASADVNKGFEQAQANQDANEASLGTNPGDGAHASAARGLAIARAGATAGAITKARGDAEDKAYNTLNDVSARGNQDLAIATGAAGAQGNQLLGSQQNQINWQRDQADAYLRSRGLQQNWDLGQRNLDIEDKKVGQGQQNIDNQGTAGIGSLVGAGLTAAAIYF